MNRKFDFFGVRWVFISLMNTKGGIFNRDFVARKKIGIIEINIVLAHEVRTSACFTWTDNSCLTQNRIESHEFNALVV